MALRWAALGVDYEMSGKDHIDNVKTSSKICKVLGGTPPAPMASSAQRRSSDLCGLLHSHSAHAAAAAAAAAASVGDVPTPGPSGAGRSA